MYDHMYAYIFLKMQCRFRKGYKTQYCLKSMAEKLWKVLGTDSNVGDIFTDPSKIFSCTGSQIINC